MGLTKKWQAAAALALSAATLAGCTGLNGFGGLPGTRPDGSTPWIKPTSQPAAQTTATNQLPPSRLPSPLEEAIRICASAGISVDPMNKGQNYAVEFSVKTTHQAGAVTIGWTPATSSFDHIVSGGGVSFDGLARCQYYLNGASTSAACITAGTLTIYNLVPSSRPLPLIPGYNSGGKIDGGTTVFYSRSPKTGVFGDRLFEGQCLYDIKNGIR